MPFYCEKTNDYSEHRLIQLKIREEFQLNLAGFRLLHESRVCPEQTAVLSRLVN